MKFTCGHCGKRYASLDEAVPGRTYRVRCGRCGQLMTVVAPAAGAGAERAPGTPEPDLELDVAVVAEDAAEARAALLSAIDREARLAGLAAPRRPLGAGAGDGSEEFPIDLALSDEFPLERRRRRGLLVASLVITAFLAGVTLAWLVRAQHLARSAPSAPPPDVSTRSGVRPGPTGALTRASQAEAVEPPPVGAGGEAAGVRSSAGTGPAARPAAAGPATAPGTMGERTRRQQAARAPAVAFEPRAGDARTAKVDAGLAETMRRKEDATVTTAGPDVNELRATLEAGRGELERCADGARGTAGAAPWAGRRPQLVVTVLPTGEAQGRLDDAALEATELAACLRRAVARTAFPRFTGEAVELRTPAPVP